MSLVNVPLGMMRTQSVVIANAATTSAAINTGGMSLVGINFPAAFTGTTVTFSACDTADGTFQSVYNSAGIISVTIAQGRYYAFDPKDFQGIKFLKIISGSSEAAERTLTVSLKGI